MSEWTAGPWSACKCGMIWDATGNCLVAVAQGSMHLESDKFAGPDCTPNDDAQRAKAALIAAAPDYAAAAEQMLAYEQAGGDGWWKGFEMLKTAHAKARSRAA